MSNKIPRLPKSAYRGPVGEFVKLMDGNTEAAPEFLYSTFMAAVGAAVPQAIVEYEENGLPLTLYVVNLGPTGTRKSSAKRRALDVVNTAMDGALTVKRGGFTPEGVQRVLSKVSPGVLEYAPAVVWDVGEFTGLMKTADRAGNPVIELLLDGYDAPKKYSKELSDEKKSIDLYQLRLGLVGDSTPDHFGKSLTETHVRMGFVNRLDIFMGEMGIPIPRPKPVDSKALDELVIRPLREAHMRWVKDGVVGSRVHRSLFPTAEADALWDELYVNDVQPMMGSDESELYARFDMKVWKYAGLYAFLEGTDRITPEHLNVAFEVNEYLCETVRRASGEFGMTDKQRFMDHIEGLIQRSGPEGRPNMRHLNQSVAKSMRPLMAQYGLDRTVDQLIADGAVERDGDRIVHADHRDGRNA